MIWGVSFLRNWKSNASNNKWKQFSTGIERKIKRWKHLWTLHNKNCKSGLIKQFPFRGMATGSSTCSMQRSYYAPSVCGKYSSGVFLPFQLLCQAVMTFPGTSFLLQAGAILLSPLEWSRGWYHSWWKYLEVKLGIEMRKNNSPFGVVYYSCLNLFNASILFCTCSFW